jgi:hypothetical protein
MNLNEGVPGMAKLFEASGIAVSFFDVANKPEVPADIPISYEDLRVYFFVGDTNLERNGQVVNVFGSATHLYDVLHALILKRLSEKKATYGCNNGPDCNGCENDLEGQTQAPSLCVANGMKRRAMDYVNRDYDTEEHRLACNAHWRAPEFGDDHSSVADVGYESGSETATVPYVVHGYKGCWGLSLKFVGLKI